MNSLEKAIAKLGKTTEFEQAMERYEEERDEQELRETLVGLGLSPADVDLYIDLYHGEELPPDYDGWGS